MKWWVVLKVVWTRTRCSTMSGLDERAKILYPRSMVDMNYKFSDGQCAHALLSEV